MATPKGKLIATYAFELPVAADALGRWVEEHGANISMHCMMGRWQVSVSWKRMHSYSDDRGEHSEHRRVARMHQKPDVAFGRAVRAAMAIQAGEPLPEERD